MRSVSSVKVDTPSTHLTELQQFATVMSLHPCDADAVRDAAKALSDAAGEEAFADALGVVAFFAFISRVVDATGHNGAHIKFGTTLRKTGYPRLVLASMAVGAAAVVLATGWNLAKLASRWFWQ